MARKRIQPGAVPPVPPAAPIIQAPAPPAPAPAPVPGERMPDGGFSQGPGDRFPARPARPAGPLAVTYPNQPGGLKPTPAAGPTLQDAVTPPELPFAGPRPQFNPLEAQAGADRAAFLGPQTNPNPGAALADFNPTLPGHMPASPGQVAGIAGQVNDPMQRVAGQIQTLANRPAPPAPMNDAYRPNTAGLNNLEAVHAPAPSPSPSLQDLQARAGTFDRPISMSVPGPPPPAPGGGYPVHPSAPPPVQVASPAATPVNPGSYQMSPPAHPQGPMAPGVGQLQARPGAIPTGSPRPTAFGQGVPNGPGWASFNGPPPTTPYGLHQSPPIPVSGGPPPAPAPPTGAYPVGAGTGAGNPAPAIPLGPASPPGPGPGTYPVNRPGAVQLSSPPAPAPNPGNIPVANRVGVRPTPPPRTPTGSGGFPGRTPAAPPPPVLTPVPPTPVQPPAAPTVHAGSGVAQGGGLNRGANVVGGPTSPLPGQPGFKAPTSPVANHVANAAAARAGVSPAPAPTPAPAPGPANLPQGMAPGAAPAPAPPAAKGVKAKVASGVNTATSAAGAGVRAGRGLIGRGAGALRGGVPLLGAELFADPTGTAKAVHTMTHQNPLATAGQMVGGLWNDAMQSFDNAGTLYQKPSVDNAANLVRGLPIAGSFFRAGEAIPEYAARAFSDPANLTNNVAATGNDMWSALTTGETAAEKAGRLATENAPGQNGTPSEVDQLNAHFNAAGVGGSVKDAAAGPATSPAAKAGGGSPTAPAYAAPQAPAGGTVTQRSGGPAGSAQQAAQAQIAYHNQQAERLMYQARYGNFGMEGGSPEALIQAASHHIQAAGHLASQLPQFAETSARYAHEDSPEKRDLMRAQAEKFRSDAKSPADQIREIPTDAVNARKFAMVHGQDTAGAQQYVHDVGAIPMTAKDPVTQATYGHHLRTNPMLSGLVPHLPLQGGGQALLAKTLSRVMQFPGATTPGHYVNSVIREGLRGMYPGAALGEQVQGMKPGFFGGDQNEYQKNLNYLKALGLM